MSSKNGVWDKNGGCVECGFIPFKNTDKCFVCNPPTNIAGTADYDKNNCEEAFVRETCEKEYAEEEESVTWEINIKKTIIINEDEMFVALAMSLDLLSLDSLSHDLLSLDSLSLDLLSLDSLSLDSLSLNSLSLDSLSLDSLDEHNEREDTEKNHIIEEQIYMRIY